MRSSSKELDLDAIRELVRAWREDRVDCTDSLCDALTSLLSDREALTAELAGLRAALVAARQTVNGVLTYGGDDDPGCLPCVRLERSNCRLVALLKKAGVR